MNEFSDRKNRALEAHLDLEQTQQHKQFQQQQDFVEFSNNKQSGDSRSGSIPDTLNPNFETSS